MQIVVYLYLFLCRFRFLSYQVRVKKNVLYLADDVSDSKGVLKKICFLNSVSSLVKSSQEFHYKNVLDLADDVSEEFKNKEDKDCF